MRAAVAVDMALLSDHAAFGLDRTLAFGVHPGKFSAALAALLPFGQASDYPGAF
jgi:hypothetical protein